MQDAQGRLAPLTHPGAGDKLQEEAKAWLTTEAAATLLEMAGYESGVIMRKVWEVLGP